jgi:predicted O-methyltransferase YrrM
MDFHELIKQTSIELNNIDFSDELARHSVGPYEYIKKQLDKNHPEKTLYYFALAALVKLLGVKRPLEVGARSGVGAICLAKYADAVETMDINPFDLLPTIYQDPKITFTRVRSPDEYLGINIENYDFFFIDEAHEGRRELKFHRMLNEKYYKGIVVYDDVNIEEMKVNFWNHVTNDKATLPWNSAGFGIVSYEGKTPTEYNSLDELVVLVKQEMKRIDWLEELKLFDFSRVEHLRRFFNNADNYSRHYYNALGAIASIVKPRRVLEIGAEFGISALSLAKSGCEVDSYDLDLSRIFDERLFNIKNIHFHGLPEHNSCVNIDFTKYDLIFLDFASRDAQYEQEIYQKIVDMNRDVLLILDDCLTPRLSRFYNNIQQPKVILQEWHAAGFALVQIKQRNPVSMRSGTYLEGNAEIQKRRSLWSKLWRMTAERFVRKR